MSSPSLPEKLQLDLLDCFIEFYRTNKEDITAIQAMNIESLDQEAFNIVEAAIILQQYKKT